jgi:hypothetical protein
MTQLQLLQLDIASPRLTCQPNTLFKPRQLLRNSLKLKTQQQKRNHNPHLDIRQLPSPATPNPHTEPMHRPSLRIELPSLRLNPSLGIKIPTRLVIPAAILLLLEFLDALAACRFGDWEGGTEVSGTGEEHVDFCAGGDEMPEDFRIDLRGTRGDGSSVADTHTLFEEGVKVGDFGLQDCVCGGSFCGWEGFAKGGAQLFLAGGIYGEEFHYPGNGCRGSFVALFSTC